MTYEEIKELLLEKQPKFLVIGDGCIDDYHYGSVSRISPEAPVPVFDFEYAKIKYGMAFNVYENLAKLVKTDFDRFIDIKERKNRYIDEKSNQQLFRVDQKIEDLSGLRAVDRCIAYLEKFEYDAVIISDYNKGTLEYHDIEEIIKICKKKEIDVFLDTKKKDLACFDGAFIKINEKEYDERTTRSSKMIVTRADKDVLYFPAKGKNAHSTFKVDKKKFRDVTGAGDTFLAAVSFMYALTKDINTSIKFAIQASQVSIQHYGCYAPALEEICDSSEE
jgi:bifunctional ADP-heptose synthase (sugar kinase/adenylyltransferase)